MTRSQARNNIQRAPPAPTLQETDRTTGGIGQRETNPGVIHAAVSRMIILRLRPVSFLRPPLSHAHRTPGGSK